MKIRDIKILSRTPTMVEFSMVVDYGPMYPGKRDFGFNDEGDEITLKVIIPNARAYGELGYDGKRFHPKRFSAALKPMFPWPGMLFEAFWNAVNP